MRIRTMVRLSPLLAVCVTGLSAVTAAQSNWVDWVDETSTRIVGDPAVTTADPEEKDIFAADFDNDGDKDVVIARKVPFSMPGPRNNVLLMNEGGVLVDRTAQFTNFGSVADDSRDILAFDANGDGWLDLVTATTFSDVPRLWINLAEDGNGNWQGFGEMASWFEPSFPVGPRFCAVYSGDVDNDNDPDLFFSDYDNSLEDRLLINRLNEPVGKFVDETSTRLSAAAAGSVFGTGNFIYDFNKDGWADILKSSGSFEPVRLLINDGAGNFTQIQTFNTDAAYMVRPADFDNDGRMDFYVVDDDQDYFYSNDATNPNGTLSTTRITVTHSGRTTNFGGNVRETDIDMDGWVDLGVADVDVDIPGCSRRFVALRNRLRNDVDGLSDPNSGLPVRDWNTQGTHDLAFLDLNGDGLQDMIHGQCGGLKVYIMQPIPDLIGSSFCESTPNSDGTSALVNAVGSTSLGDNNFRLAVRGAKADGFGIFFYGTGALNGVPFGEGLRCVGGHTQRLNPPQRIGVSEGLSSRKVDLASGPAGPNGPLPITVGSWSFQFWYRDQAGGPSGFNLSDACTVTFAP